MRKSRKPPSTITRAPGISSHATGKPNINDHNKHTVDGQIVQAATKCKRAALKRQLEMPGQTDFLKFPYRQGIIKNEIPLSVGGGIGHERTMMLLLRKTHLGGVTVSVWLKV